MGVFHDRNGAEWHVDINVSSLRRVRDGGLGIDLLDITDEHKRVASRLSEDPILLVGVLYEICRPEISARGMAAAQFDELFDGPAIDGAVVALFESLANFIPRHRGRVMAQAAVQAMRLEKLGLTEEIYRELETLGLSSIGSPEL